MDDRLAVDIPEAARLLSQSEEWGERAESYDADMPMPLPEYAAPAGRKRP